MHNRVYRDSHRGQPTGNAADAALAELRTIFGSDLILDDEDERSRYGADRVADTTYHTIPAAVVFPTRSDQVTALMKWANRTGIPVTPRGGGSGLSGAAIPCAGGVVCSMEKMNRILDIDVENMMVVVEPGVITNDLDTALEPHGLFFAGYPMSEDICFIGGNVAENAGGGRAVKYGTTGTYVTGADVVTPTGEFLKLGGKRLKDVTGYDLLHLVIGSEGTLGVITRLTIRVIPRPTVRGILLLAFSDSTSAAGMVSLLKRSPALSAVEFMDGETARNANQGLPRAKRIAIPEEAGAFLLAEFDGMDEATVAAELSRAEERAAEESPRRKHLSTGEGSTGSPGSSDRSAGATVVMRATDDAAVRRAWALRKAVPWWVKRTAPGHHSVEDVVVPPAEISALVTYADHLRRAYDVPIAVFGHAGDGNFHINPMKPEAMPPEEWRDVVDRLRRNLYRHVVGLGGTISGEHGIGRKRSGYLPLALSQPEIAAMRAIKRAWDPRGVLNPGVIFPVADEADEARETP